MKLGQIQGPDGNLVAAISEGDYFHPIPGYTLASLIEETENSTRTLSELAEELASSDAQLAGSEQCRVRRHVRLSGRHRH